MEHWNAKPPPSLEGMSPYHGLLPLENKEEGIVEALRDVQAALSSAFPGVPGSTDDAIQQLKCRKTFMAPFDLVGRTPGLDVPVVVFRDYEVLDAQICKELKVTQPSRATLNILGSKQIGRSIFLRALHVQCSDK